MNEDSILMSIKKLLIGNADDKSFDTDIIIHINTALATLNQLGVGEKSGFAISDETDTWKGLFGDNLTLIGFIKKLCIFEGQTSFRSAYKFVCSRIN